MLFSVLTGFRVNVLCLDMLHSKHSSKPSQLSETKCINHDSTKYAQAPYFIYFPDIKNIYPLPNITQGTYRRHL